MRVRVGLLLFSFALMLAVAGCEMGSNVDDSNVNNMKALEDDADIDNTSAIDAGMAVSEQSMFVYEGEISTGSTEIVINVDKKYAEGTGEIQSYALEVNDHTANILYTKLDEQDKVIETDGYTITVDTETVEDLCSKADAGNWEYIYSTILGLITDAKEAGNE